MACVYINNISQATAQSSHVQNTLISGNSWMVLRTGSETCDLAWIKAVLGIILGVSKWPKKSLLKDVLLVRNKMPKCLCQLCLSFAVDSEWANWWAWVNRKGKLNPWNGTCQHTYFMAVLQWFLSNDPWVYAHFSTRITVSVHVGSMFSGRGTSIW